MEVFRLSLVARMAGAAAVAAISIALAACGAPSNDPAPNGKTADVIVSVDGAHHVCVVALSKEQQGNSIGCGEIIAFLKDELRLPAGASYDLRTTAQVGNVELSALKDRLNAAGYRPQGAQ